MQPLGGGAQTQREHWNHRWEESKCKWSHNDKFKSWVGALGRVCEIKGEKKNKRRVTRYMTFDDSPALLIRIKQEHHKYNLQQWCVEIDHYSHCTLFNLTAIWVIVSIKESRCGEIVLHSNPIGFLNMHACNTVISRIIAEKATQCIDLNPVGLRAFLWTVHIISYHPCLGSIAPQPKHHMVLAEFNSQSTLSTLTKLSQNNKVVIEGGPGFNNLVRRMAGWMES